MQHEINIGVFDWGQFAVGGGYYPDDLPAEWQLAYFANDFGCACLRLSDYNQSPDLLMELCEDLPATFYLALLIDAQPTAAVWDMLAELSVHALVIDDDIYPKLAEQLATPDVLLADTVTLKASAVLAPGDATRAQRCVILTDIENLRATRQWIDSWAKHWRDSDGALNLWLDAAQTTPQQLFDLRAMLELMGY